jgi:LPS-assembly protein
MRSVPIFSVDSTVILERETSLFSRNVTQTLEPRLHYLFVPNRDQTPLNNARTPVNFDTGASDFNFSTIFAENRYSGGDRIADANQATATLTSRLIDPATGAELMRGLVGQRYYFTNQHVTLPGEVARTGRTADVLAALSGQVFPKTYLDTGLQYNPRDKQTERFSLAGRYQPEIGKVLNAGYRYTRSQLGQIDVSGQWPLWGGWYGIGRYNYSTLERRMIESVGGLEYDGGCWVARIVVQRIATQIQRQTTSLFVQLELNGFSRLGSNPLDILKRNVPGYGVINQPGANSNFTPN